MNPPKSDTDWRNRLGFRAGSLLAVLATWAMLTLSVQAQPRPYIGFVYPAGGQRGTTVPIRLGGQGLEGIDSVLVSGKGVTARITEFYRRLNNQELTLLNEQLRLLRKSTMTNDYTMASESATTMSESMTMMAGATQHTASAQVNIESAQQQIERIEKRTTEFVQNPACAAIASLVLVDVTIAPDAEPGEREMRLVTLRGVSNPLSFYVGQEPEISMKPMQTAIQQVLGKEAQALRKRVPGDEEVSVTLPCTVNGQIASSEVNRYRFEARQGQRLVITTLGRRLVPFIADAVPGWFQPVLALFDADGKEVAYDDDYEFRPDPTIFYEVPKDGEYVLTIRDSLYRGREDFVYRVTIGELPFITSIFPLGGRVGEKVDPRVKGWNLQGAKLASLPADAGPGIHLLTVDRGGLAANRVPFALDTLPETTDREPNNTPAAAQKVSLPAIVNGHIDRPDDRDVFRFAGKSNEVIVAEVLARRLDSPLDSILKLTDASGRVLAYNDDHEDPAAGLNTHHADSYFMVTLPADGTYYLHLGDTARQGGEDYGYRLRLGPPQPDFELRVVPSSLALRSKSSSALTVYAQRRDGFDGPIKIELKDGSTNFSAAPVTLAVTQTVARLNLKTALVATEEPVTLTVQGSAKIGELTVSHVAVPAEDRMQAFLWRQLVPAQDLKVLVFNPDYQRPPKRVLPVVPTNAPPVATAGTNAAGSSNLLAGASAPGGTNALLSATNLLAGTNALRGTNALASATNAPPARPRFTKQQIAGRLRELRLLYEEGMLTDSFYCDKVAECYAAQ